MNRFEADVDRITELRGQRMTWSMIQIMHGCSKKAMTKWRQRVNFVDPFEDVADADLDLVVESITADHPLKGHKTVDSELHGVYGVAVTRSRMRASVARVDAEALGQRRDAFGKRIVRRVYQVGGPYHLVHTDGMHKLIRYGIIVHAAIDGFTRRILWCQLSFNNRASTQLAYLLKAVREVGHWPSRMRGDCGGENVKMAEAMINVRGVNRGSFILLRQRGDATAWWRGDATAWRRGDGAARRLR